MTVTINNQKYPVVVGHRAMIDFERMANKPYNKISTLEDSTLLMWCGIKQGAKLSGMPFLMSFEDFIDYCDANPGLLDQVASISEKKTQVQDPDPVSMT